MDKDAILAISNRDEFRLWLKENGKKAKECYIVLKRGKPVDPDCFYYIDAVEEAICFGWIDSTCLFEDGVSYQRFSPRRKNSFWTELNKERARRLIKLGLMEKEGEKALPSLNGRGFKIDEDVKAALVKARCYKNSNPSLRFTKGSGRATSPSIKESANRPIKRLFLTLSKKRNLAIFMANGMTLAGC